MSYVDGYVLSVPKKNLPSYARMARKAGKIWREHGALDFKECAGDDLDVKFGIPFPRMMKVKPRLGKVLRLEALSGGEKSLAALAFIFAIQQYQPSPFYLLDEVDMFLDAVNADMVAQRVQRASKTAQFVMISLRKVTLSKADHVVGVTKGDGGISRVIMKANIGDIKDLQEELQIPEEKAEGAA